MKISQCLSVPLLALCVACHETSASTGSGAQLPAASPSASAGQAGVPSVAGTLAVPPAAGAPHATNARAFQVPALETGYQRFLGSPVEVAPGTSNDWMQWVGGPMDQDYDVFEMKGAQSPIGHHAILYTTTDANPVGFTRLWSERDQLTTQTVGGVGAEGAIPIPPGVVLRVKKGTYLVFDVHYLNPSDDPQLGQTYMDVKFTPADPAHTLASRVTNSSLMISLPPHQTVTQDLMCKLDRELRLLRFTNHMHEYGTSTLTEFIDPAGVPHMIKADDTWYPDWSLAPNYMFHPLEAPLLVPAGSVLHTRCTWNNTTEKALQFPNEMCAFSGLILGSSDVTCLDGKVANANAAAPTGTAGHAPSAGAASGACIESADRMVLDSESFSQTFKNCGAKCFGETEQCATDCLIAGTTLSPGCAACKGSQSTCSMMHCVVDCASDVASVGCQKCIETHCGAAYHQCAGL